MPYEVRKEGPKRWVIVNRDTGRRVGSSTTKQKAYASIRARYAGERKNKK